MKKNVKWESMGLVAYWIVLVRMELSATGSLAAVTVLVDIMESTANSAVLVVSMVNIAVYNVTV